MQDKSEKAIVDLKGGRIHMYLRALSSSLYPLKLRSPVRCCPLRSAAVPMPWRLPITIVTKGPPAPRRSKTQKRVRDGARGTLPLNKLAKIFTYMQHSLGAQKNPHRSRRRSILPSACWRAKREHNALNRMGYKGDGLKNTR